MPTGRPPGRPRRMDLPPTAVGPQDDVADDDEPMTPEEEAELAAQVSADHAAKAAEQADHDALLAARAEAGGPVCPNCRGELVKHGPGSPHKAGASHCNTCGKCWAPGLREERYPS